MALWRGREEVREGKIYDRKEVQFYVSRRSWRCWRTRRLLTNHAFRFEVIEVSDDAQLQVLLQQCGYTE